MIRILERDLSRVFSLILDKTNVVVKMAEQQSLR